MESDDFAKRYVAPHKSSEFLGRFSQFARELMHDLQDALYEQLKKHSTILSLVVHQGRDVREIVGEGCLSSFQVSRIAGKHRYRGQELLNFKIV